MGTPFSPIWVKGGIVLWRGDKGKRETRWTRNWPCFTADIAPPSLEEGRRGDLLKPCLSAPITPSPPPQPAGISPLQFRPPGAGHKIPRLARFPQQKKEGMEAGRKEGKEENTRRRRGVSFFLLSSSFLRKGREGSKRMREVREGQILLSLVVPLRREFRQIFIYFIGI